MKSFIYVLLLVVLFSVDAHCQNTELISGNPKQFKIVRSYYLTFDYTDLQVGKYGTEQAYIDYMMDDAEKRKQGSGPEWLIKWKKDKEFYFQPKFEELLTNYLQSERVNADTIQKGQLYEMNLHTLFIEPGFNRNGHRSPALINVKVTISQIANRGNSLVIGITDVPGNEVMGSYYSDPKRIAEAYAKCGKTLGLYLLKIVY